MESVLLAAGVLLGCAVLDWQFTRWTQSVNSERAVMAGIHSCLLAATSMVILLQSIDARWLIVPSSLGHGLGSYLAVKYPTKPNS